MCENNARSVLDLLRRPGNENCADCSAEGPEWASYNIGIFLCARCAETHQGMGSHISKVKSIYDSWEDSQIQRMRDVGNTAAKAKYEIRVPPCYRVPNQHDCDVLLEQWICAKYQREEFCRLERQPFMAGHMEGYLMKRGKEDPRYYPRKFVLSEADDTLKYYVDEKKDPKASIKVSSMNVSFAPRKMEKQSAFQITFVNSAGITRHLFVCHDDPQVTVNWYNAIRCTKLHRLQVAYPSASQAQLVNMLTKDFVLEGWLWKTGPRPTDAFKKRWFTLDQRRLMYHEDPMSAHPKGEVFLGYMLEGYSMRIGVPPGVRNQMFSFTLRTPERWYYLSAETSCDRDAWIRAISSILETQPTPQDIATTGSRMVKKRGVTLNIFSSK